MVRANGKNDLVHREWLEIFDKVLGEVRDEMHQQGRDDEFVGAKVSVLTPERSCSVCNVLKVVARSSSAPSSELRMISLASSKSV